MNIYQSPLCSCIKCGKKTSAKGIHTHFLYHHTNAATKQKLSRGQALGAKNGNAQASKLSQEKRKLLEEKYQLSPSLCNNCNIIMHFDKQKNKFCSRKCSVIFNNKKRTETGFKHSPETKNKISKTLYNNPNKNNKKKTKPPYTKLYGYSYCSCCSKGFWQLSTYRRKTCSPECQRQNSTYRKIVHEYFHNGRIYLLESSWEVEIADWLSENNIMWLRPKHIPWKDSTGKNRRYFPDFYLPEYDVYLDPKNSYQISISTEKLRIISSKVILFYGAVDHIKQNLLSFINNCGGCWD